MDEARFAAIHQLDLETPVEFARLGDEGTLEVHHDLIQERLIRAVVEKSAEVLIVPRGIGIGGDTAFDPARNGQPRFRFFLLDELGLGPFLFRSEGLRADPICRDRKEDGSSKGRPLCAEEAGVPEPSFHDDRTLKRWCGANHRYLY